MTYAAFTDAFAGHARSLRLWVLDIAFWLARITQWRVARLSVRRDLRRLRAEVRYMLVLRLSVEARMGRIRLPVRSWTPCAHRLDVRAGRRRYFRYVLRGVRLRTFAEIRRLLDDLDAHAERCVANLAYCMTPRAPVSRIARGGPCIAVAAAHPRVEDTS